MSEETIKIKNQIDITRVSYFTNVIAKKSDVIQVYNETVRSPWNSILNSGKEAYALMGNANQIIEMIDLVDGVFCKRISLTNEYKFLNSEESKNVIKGLRYSADSNKLLSSVEKINIETNFSSEASALSGSNAYTFIQFYDKKQNDYNVDISIQRTIDTLDTLSVKNNPYSQIPFQESETGVVIGTLYATQKILDENGDKVKIPLSNVPIVIFNESDEFPQVSSVDEDGNRISLNIMQNSNPEDYQDLDSYVLEFGKKKAEKILNKTLDNRFDGVRPLLKSVETLNVPEKYKYSTITNENGEFMLENIPVGNRILMFEVDLLKQGMTKSEVSLNFFPYPTDSEPNLDDIPHFYFRQLAINVVPSWGNFQTGYTQVDIFTNIDMRKWSTFYVSPISLDGKSVEEIMQTGRFESLNFLARDMTIEGYPLTSKVVEINNIYEREQSQRLEWSNEFVVKKPKIEFRSDNYQVFKLPANLYDPNGRSSKTPGRDSVSNRNGVWLCSYQLKMFYGFNDKVNRTTGFVRNDLKDNAKNSNHFDINRGEGYNSESATGGEVESSLGVFPYEKPWTINYPEPYKIPTRPVNPDSEKDYSLKVQPRYLDGDLSGEYYDNGEARGYGSMQSLEGGELIFNKFAQSVTKFRIYKYESNVSWHEEYSNGFRKHYHSQLFPNKNYEVLNGEKYQRIEAGFGYWLRPEGWGRVEQTGWGDFMLSSDINSGYTPPSNLIPNTYIQNMYRNGENLYLKFDSNISRKWLLQGALDIYRVIDDNPENIEFPTPPITKKAVEINLQYALRNNQKDSDQRMQLKFGNGKAEIINATSGQVDIMNNGSVNSNVSVDGIQKVIKPGAKETFNIFGGSKIKLPSNSEFNLLENYYNRVNYNLDFKTLEIPNAGEVIYGFNNINVEAGNFNNPSQYYLITRLINVKGNVKFKDGVFDKCKDSYQQDGNYEINGIVFDATKSDSPQIYFRSSPANTHCSDGGFNVLRVS